MLSDSRTERFRFGDDGFELNWEKGHRGEQFSDFTGDGHTCLSPANHTLNLFDDGDTGREAALLFFRICNTFHRRGQQHTRSGTLVFSLTQPSEQKPHGETIHERHREAQRCAEAEEGGWRRSLTPLLLRPPRRRAREGRR